MEKHPSHLLFQERWWSQIWGQLPQYWEGLFCGYCTLVAQAQSRSSSTGHPSDGNGSAFPHSWHNNPAQAPPHWLFSKGILSPSCAKAPLHQITLVVPFQRANSSRSRTKLRKWFPQKWEAATLWKRFLWVFLLVLHNFLLPELQQQ